MLFAARHRLASSLAIAVVVLTTQTTRAQRTIPAPAVATSDFTLAAAGDALVTMRFASATEPEFLQLVKSFRESDVGFANLETLFHEYQGATDPQFTGTLLQSNPTIAEELKWAGFTLLARANNHVGDYGEYGMRRTTEVLDRLGIVHAGVGRTLGEARRPAYLTTAKGRVALISCTSTFLPVSRAGDARGDVPGRPGASTLRHQRTYKVDAAQLAALTGIAEKVGLRSPKPDPSGVFTLFGSRFQVAAEAGSEWTANERDVREILATVREARRQADFVIVTTHTHESGADATEPPPFLPGFARACIDAGADVFVGHGPHQLRGVKIYKGKAIFYSLGNLFFQNDAVERLPADFYEKFGVPAEGTTADAFDARDAKGQGDSGTQAYFESALTRSQYHEGRLVAVTLYPLTLGYQQPRSRRGRPVLASGADGRRIIEDLARMSAPFGTKIEYRDGVGVIDLGAGTVTSTRR
jgi:poly-gamma-glutamate synthesis protein (capsule biosynthesis protein)